jgi:hypothetical protein
MMRPFRGLVLLALVVAAVAASPSTRVLRFADGLAQRKIADAVVQLSFSKDDIAAFRSRVAGYHPNGVTPFDDAMSIELRD